jgi:hypothetical protein
MAMPLPNLDDRSFDDLTAEARALIPALLPEWTDHNPSDPGIVVVELLAWLTEMLLFQVNEIPPASVEAFLAYLNEPGWPRSSHPTVDEAILATRRALRTRYRAVTPDDHERLVADDWSGPPRIARVRCLPGRNLAAADVAVREQAAPAHVSVVVVPERPAGAAGPPLPAAAACAAIAAFLAPRCTLTTRLHVVPPMYVPVSISGRIWFRDHAPPGAAESARQALTAFHDPLTGGADGTGWPFGRAVYVSEVYARLEQLAGVGFVEDVVVAGPRPITDPDGTVIGVALDDHELVQLGPVTFDVHDDYGRLLPPGPPAATS